MSNDYIVVVQANLHKKSECNADIALYANFLLKRYHIDKNGITKGMNPTFNTKFRYSKADTLKRPLLDTATRSMSAESPSSSPRGAASSARPQKSSGSTFGAA